MRHIPRGALVASVLSGGSYASKVLALSPIAYWPLTEASGTVAVARVGTNGTYARDVSTMGTGAGIGDGNTAPDFDGTNDYVNVYSAGLAAAFSAAKGTLSIWFSGAQWTDSSNDVSLHVGVDTTANYVRLMKGSTANRYEYVYMAGSTLKQVLATSKSDAGWVHVAITWDTTADEVKAYYGGAQSGSTLTGLGTWAGDLAATRCVIGAQVTTPSLQWNGLLAHAAIFDKALTPTQIAALASV